MTEQVRFTKYEVRSERRLTHVGCHQTGVEEMLKRPGLLTIN